MGSWDQWTVWVVGKECIIFPGREFNCWCDLWSPFLPHCVNPKVLVENMIASVGLEMQMSDGHVKPCLGPTLHLPRELAYFRSLEFGICWLTSLTRWIQKPQSLCVLWSTLAPSLGIFCCDLSCDWQVSNGEDGGKREGRMYWANEDPCLFTKHFWRPPVYLGSVYYLGYAKMSKTHVLEDTGYQGRLTHKQWITLETHERHRVVGLIFCFFFYFFFF